MTDTVSLIDRTAFDQAIAENAQYDTGWQKDRDRLEAFVSYYESCKNKIEQPQDVTITHDRVCIAGRWYVATNDKHDPYIAINALGRLIRLKEHKDKHGKDAFYEENMPDAWEQARDAISGNITDQEHYTENEYKTAVNSHNVTEREQCFKTVQPNGSQSPTQTLIKALEAGRQNIHDAKDITGFMLAMDIVRKHVALPVNEDEMLQKIALFLCSNRCTICKEIGQCSNAIKDYGKEAKGLLDIIQHNTATNSMKAER